MVKTPRPYQETAINNSISYFKENDRGKLIMACGSGKTLTSFWIIADKLEAQKIIIVIPSINLERQTLKTWVDESVANKNKFNFLCICSDGTVSEDVELDKQTVIPVTTNVNEAVFWLRMNKYKPIVIFTTYQSCDVVSKAAQKTKTVFDFGVLDEAHRTVGKLTKPFSK